MADSPFQISLVTAPSITMAPESQLEVLPGENVVFTVTAEGDALIYQWRKDGDNIDNMAGVYSGTDAATLTVLSASEPEDEGEYTVAVFNIQGLVTSNPPAILEIGECNIPGDCIQITNSVEHKFEIRTHAAEYE